MTILPLASTVTQLAYVTTPDRFDAMLDFWTAAYGAGPFYEWSLAITDQQYFGEPTAIEARFAMTYLGETQVELMAQTNDARSPYLDVLAAHGTPPVGGLFHHIQLAVDDYDADRRRLLAAGLREGMTAIANGKKLCYLDGREQLGHFVELVEPMGLEPLFDAIRDECARWDGTDRIRDYRDFARRFQAASQANPGAEVGAG